MDFSELHQKKTVYWSYFTAWTIILTSEREEAEWRSYGNGEFCRAIHNIENAPFRTKFDRDVDEMKGNLGIGCISDYEPQPLLIQSHHGSFAIVTVGKINNEEELLEKVFEEGHSHFQEMSGGKINATELVASLICKRETLVEGIRYVQETVNGSHDALAYDERRNLCGA